MLMQLFEKVVVRIINRLIRSWWYVISLFRKNKHYLLFIPHFGMCANDKYSIINPNSDSALSFAKYIIDNNLALEYELVILDSEENNTDRFKAGIKDLLAKRGIHIIYGVPKFENLSMTRPRLFWKYCIILSATKFVFSSTPHYSLMPFSKNIPVINLNYYSAPFKNDLLDGLRYKTISNKKFRYWLTSSGLTLRLELPIYDISYKSYLDFGLCRNDSLINKKDVSTIRESIINSVPYSVKKIVLYTPTHRDYEENTHVSRNILGFNDDLTLFGEWLCAQGTLIICKVHPKQNKEVITRQLPSSIKIFQPTEMYGLCELMQISDCLITDYTSGYFDYLLLDKPVIFNFYDEERYEQTRGFTFSPVSSILAGDVVKDCSSLKTALCDLESNCVRYKEKREFVRNLCFKYQDGGACKRVYEYFFVKI